MRTSAKPATPIALRRAIDAAALCREDPCDGVEFLGSFWPNSKGSLESHVVKSFKECHPATDFEPHITRLTEFYADLIVRALGGQRFDWVARVLSSAETHPDSLRPQSRLVEMLCARTGARDLTHIFLKSASRPPMRVVERLGGSEALARRIAYVVQDLFIRPIDAGGRVLLVDDIANTGASMRVYARALKDFAGAREVRCVNLAATRFERGKDGRGMLKLDTSGLEGRPGLGRAWLDTAGVAHRRQDCPSIQGSPGAELEFICDRKGSPCPECAPRGQPKRKWWRRS